MSKSTWMSSGSGSGVYDPVTTGDNVRINYDDESWLSFKGGRKFKFGTYRESGLKGLCDDIRNRTRPKCLMLVFIATVVLILLVMIVVLASSHSAKPPGTKGFEKWENKPTGLNFLPVGVENSVYLHFSVQEGKEDSYLKYTNGLDKALDDYKTSFLHNGTHVLCNSTFAPGNAVCQQPLTVFGVSCKHTHRYGYHVGQPCVLLYFNAPKNYTVRGLLPKDKSYVNAESTLGDRFSLDNVGISCEPATAEDQKYFGKEDSDTGSPIEYSPPKGFPTYFFRKRSVDKFIPPAVMVQFRTIRSSVSEPHMVRIKCTAWGKVFDAQENPVNSDMFTTSFVFRIH